jgi:hypothetical protein
MMCAKKKGMKVDHAAGAPQFPSNKLAKLWITELARHRAT